MDWRRMLAYVTGTVDQELLLRNEYLLAENRILRGQVKGAPRISDGDRRTLAEIGKRLGRRALEEIASIVRPETILEWHRRLVARKFENPTQPRGRGRPPITAEVEQLIVRLASENRSWGYDRIVGALANLGIGVSDRTVANVLKRHGIPPAPTRRKGTTWKEFIQAHQSVLAAADFFTAEVWTLRGLVTCYVLFVIHLATRRVEIAGVTCSPNGAWMRQVGRDLTAVGTGALSGRRYLLMDRDTKFRAGFRSIVESSGTKCLRLPARSPNLNAVAERFVRSVKEECVERLVFFGERSLRRALDEFVAHYHAERNHQGKGNLLLFPRKEDEVGDSSDPVVCRPRLGGLLKFYRRVA